MASFSLLDLPFSSLFLLAFASASLTVPVGIISNAPFSRAIAMVVVVLAPMLAHADNTDPWWFFRPLPDPPSFRVNIQDPITGTWSGPYATADECGKVKEQWLETRNKNVSEQKVGGDNKILDLKIRPFDRTVLFATCKQAAEKPTGLPVPNKT